MSIQRVTQELATECRPPKGLRMHNPLLHGSPIETWFKNDGDNCYTFMTVLDIGVGHKVFYEHYNECGRRVGVQIDELEEDEYNDFQRAVSFAADVSKDSEELAEVINGVVSDLSSDELSLAKVILS